MTITTLIVFGVFVLRLRGIGFQIYFLVLQHWGLDFGFQ
jgi:hypothetical protein